MFSKADYLQAKLALSAHRRGVHNYFAEKLAFSEPIIEFRVPLDKLNQHEQHYSTPFRLCCSITTLTSRFFILLGRHYY